MTGYRNTEKPRDNQSLLVNVARMEDDKLAKLHSSYKSQAEQRGKKGGLGVNEVYNFGFEQHANTNANGLKKDPKQPYIRFVKAGYKPPQPTNKKVFVDSDAESEPEVETKKMKKKKKKLEQRNGTKKRKRSAGSNSEEVGEKKVKKNGKAKTKKAKMKMKKMDKVEEVKVSKEVNGRVKSKKAKMKKMDKPVKVSKKEVSGRVKTKKKANMAKEVCESVKCLKLSEGDDVLAAVKRLVSTESSLLTVVGDVKVLKGEDGLKKKSVKVYSASFDEDGDDLRLVALSSKGKVIQTSVMKGTKAGDNLRVILL